MKKNIIIFIFLALFLNKNLCAQTTPSSGEIYNQLQRLNFLGSVLYIAAHPDDENTRLISYFSNYKHARTAYLSLTRGGGGQNLIGSELKEYLGVIRTQELLSARKIDAGEQFFTSAIDFGYSKHPKETFKIWNKELLLSEVVFLIRKFQPDIIINRFKHDTPGSTHGHHTSSAILSKEAFELANNPTVFPNQLENVNLWQAKRLFFNTSWWFYGSREKFKNADKTNLIPIEVGLFDPITGKYNSEIAALSRSQHKSQGFGSSPNLGKNTEYIEYIAGSFPENKDPFYGINTRWSRIKGGKKIGEMVDDAIKNFDFKNPANSIPQLLEIHKKISQLKKTKWKEIKQKEVTQIIEACLGLSIQVNAPIQYATNGDDIDLTIKVINNSPFPINWKKTNVGTNEKIINTDLKENELVVKKILFSINTEITTPYWLLEKRTKGRYTIKKEQWKGRAQTPPLKVIFTLLINDYLLSFEKNINYRYNDPIKGEIIQPFYILPKVAATFLSPVYLFTENKNPTISVKIESFAEKAEGNIQIKSPKNWKIIPDIIPFSLNQRGASKLVNFKVSPSKNEPEGNLIPLLQLKNDSTFSSQIKVIEYDHISKQFAVMPSKIKVAKLNITIPYLKIGYIKGAGDKIPESLQQIGVSVVPININTTTLKELQQYNTIIMGIRAFNTVEILRLKNKLLWEYVKKGGNLLIQYNTTRGLKTKEIAPYSLSLSRDRVTDENAKISILEPNHTIFNYPNKITEKDFENWTQERGLYFANSWDDNFLPLLAMNDEGETSKKGSLLIANYGKGKIIYTGLSFFRQLPAGVTGAYRLFINLISQKE